MKRLFYLVAFMPMFAFATAENISFHLACQKGDTCANFESDSGTVSLKQEPEMVLDESNLVSADVNQDEYGRPELSLRFDQENAKKFATATEKSAGSFLAIVVGGKIVSQPNVSSKIESDSVRLTAGMGKTPFWDDISWIKAKAAAKRNKFNSENNHALVIYLAVGILVLAGGLWFLLRGRIGKINE